MHGCNELRFNLTADNINAIFKMYPGGRKFWKHIKKTSFIFNDEILNKFHLEIVLCRMCQ